MEWPRVEVELNDTSVHWAKCERGHESVISLVAEKYELLFEVAMSAFNDGYSDAAVLRASTALERFLEYFVKVWVHKVFELSEGDLPLLKLLSNSSERQFGCFLWVASIEFGADEEWIRQIKEIEKIQKLRNRVAHKGYHPSKSETEKHLREIFDLIYRLKCYASERMQSGLSDRSAELQLQTSQAAEKLKIEKNIDSPYGPTSLHSGLAFSKLSFDGNETLRDLFRHFGNGDFVVARENIQKNSKR